jgi:hypothetical protein
MGLCVIRFCRGFLVSVLVVIFAFPPDSFAESAHLVSPSDLRQEMLRASRVREHNQRAIQQLLSSDEGQQALRSVHVDGNQVKQAVSTLTDAELARLAERAERAQADFAAGALSKEALLIIVIAVVVVIIIVVAKT